MAISGDVFRINQIFELTQKDQFNYVLDGPDFTYGWFAGGFPGPVSTVDRINFASDSGTAAVRGPLSAVKSYAALNGVGDREFGWFISGSIGTPSATTNVDRVAFKSDSVTATTRGPVSLGRSNSASVKTRQYGWIAGGRVSPITIGTQRASSTERISYSDDTQILSIRGALINTYEYSAGVSDWKAYGWVIGGHGHTSPALTTTTTTQRIIFSSDTTTATVRGNLPIAKSYLSSVFNFNNGWAMGGLNPSLSPAYLTSVDRINFSTDTAALATRFNTSLLTYVNTGTGNNDQGWFGGGTTSSGTETANVIRITYASDTGVSSRGPLSLARRRSSSTSGNI